MILDRKQECAQEQNEASACHAPGKKLWPSLYFMLGACFHFACTHALFRRSRTTYLMFGYQGFVSAAQPRSHKDIYESWGP